MKIAHLSVGDPFTAKWVHSQSKMGHEVHLIMLEPPEELLNDDIITHLLPVRTPMGYYLNVLHLRRLLRKLKPDLFHVHYAGGNGLLGRLAGFHPCILSVWGSDVMVIPHKSNFWKRIIVKNLRHYDWLCSTSRVLADHATGLYPELSNLSLTPIGVDTRIFSRNPSRHDNSIMTIGTVKELKSVYGIDISLKAFNEVRNRLVRVDSRISEMLRFLIVGDGPQRSELERLVSDLDLKDVVEFAGQVQNRKVPDFLSRMDIFVTMSRSESFGVSVLEASACELPVVVSNVGGLPEVAQDGITGFIVENENVSACADAFVELIGNEALRRQLGIAGRKMVKERYEWNHCMTIMEEVYDDVIGVFTEKQECIP